MGKNSNIPVLYFLVDSNGLKELRGLQKDLHLAVETMACG